MSDFTQWSSLSNMMGVKPSWVPEEDRERLAAYLKYDELYWNDPTQFSLRVLEGEEPLYIPNARTIIDTTAHYVLKGLNIKVPNPDQNAAMVVALNAFLDRELFYSRFHTAKHRGVAIGDYAFHLTANPRKLPGSRLSFNSIDPSALFPIYDDDIPDKLIGCHIAEQYTTPEEPSVIKIRKLTYRTVEDAAGNTKRISREEGIYKLEPKWYGPEPELISQTIPLGLLDERITSIPIYWFKNIDWDGQLFGSSEIRGFESILRAISQGSTDVSMALALEGLGVYATDGGRPVDDQGVETDWEVAPGKVMEVPTGSYFRRIEGVGSITPATDQINYLETKLREASSLSDVALGQVDVQTAQSGIALAIKFMPTLAKVDERDRAGLGKLKQFFFDWKIWHGIFEGQTFDADITPEIGDKLPSNRTERINELNNMLDRQVISIQYYRDETGKLGYVFPADIQAQVDADVQRKAEQAAAAAPEALQPNAVAAATGALPPPAGGGMAEKAAKTNQSNNKSRTNESNGTESGQPLARQAKS